MAEYQEARKEKTEKLKGRLEETREEAISRQDLPDGTPCPSCGAANPPEAEFCCECGFPLRQAAFCPSCGAKTNPGADICPVCGTWLLDGKCTFCYAEIPPDAEFCPECGNPRGGVSCPSCGTLSIFDFCKKCGTPLTEGAQAALEEAKSDPDAQAVLAAVREAGAIEAQLAELEEKLRELPPEAGPDEAPAPPQKRKAFFSAAQLAAIHGSKHLVDAAEQHKQEE
jgi:ribosomal protein L40E